MAEVLDEFPKKRRNDPKYPDEWFDGRVWKITQADLAAVGSSLNLKQFGNTLTNLANRRGRSARRQTVDQGKALIFQCPAMELS